MLKKIGKKRHSTFRRTWTVDGGWAARGWQLFYFVLGQFLHVYNILWSLPQLSLLSLPLYKCAPPSLPVPLGDFCPLLLFCDSFNLSRAIGVSIGLKQPIEVVTRVTLGTYLKTAIPSSQINKQLNSKGWGPLSPSSYKPDYRTAWLF